MALPTDSHHSAYCCALTAAWSARCFSRVLPAIFSSFRILYDIGWTYVILAEMVNARKGVGYMVEAARKVLDFERVYAGIIAIGLAAFFFRWLLTLLERWLFPWRFLRKAEN